MHWFKSSGWSLVDLSFFSSGLSIHTFHGNFFVRSTDLLSLANVNPDSAFAVQMSIDDSLVDSSLACFQAALLYTSSKGIHQYFILIHTFIYRLLCCTPPVKVYTNISLLYTNTHFYIHTPRLLGCTPLVKVGVHSLYMHTQIYIYIGSTLTTGNKDIFYY